MELHGLTLLQTFYMVAACKCLDSILNIPPVACIGCFAVLPTLKRMPDIPRGQGWLDPSIANFEAEA
jgi:hypothetical protein